MQLAPVTSKASTLLERVITKKTIKWTNRYDCPPGYSFNEDGWVETNNPYPKITVSFLPHLISKLGEYNLIFQNLLALRLLNDMHHSELELAVWNRSKQALFGREPDERIFKDAVEASRKITDTTQLPDFVSDILRMDTVWYAKDCATTGRAAIKAILRHGYISDMRALMPISRKYKTESVMSEGSLTKYAVNLYWKDSELTAVNRTVGALVEAINEINDSGDEFTVELMSTISGVSNRSIQRYKTMWAIGDGNV